MFKMSVEDSSAATGVDPTQRERVTAQGEGAREAQHTQVIFDGFVHGDFKYPPFAAAEEDAWSWVGAVRAAIYPSARGPNDDQAIRQRRADESADAAVQWVLRVSHSRRAEMPQRSGAGAETRERSHESDP